MFLEKNPVLLDMNQEIFHSRETPDYWPEDEIWAVCMAQPNLQKTDWL